MKILIHIHLSGRLIILLICQVFFVAATAKPKPVSRIALYNNLSINRDHEVISFNKNDLGAPENNAWPVIYHKRQPVPFQLVDNNQDGQWDRLLIEISLPAFGRDTLDISWGSINEAGRFPPFTSVYLSKKSKTGLPGAEISLEKRPRGFSQNIADPYYQLEGPGIENDKVAFRSFFDYRNGKDIYGKLVDTPVLKQVGLNASWHKMQPWGMDVLRVGNSLGAGALAIKEKDRLFILGDADTSVFTIGYQGALGAAFQLDFNNWDIGLSKGKGSELISITKGTFYYKNEISLSLRRDQELVAGFANFINDSLVHTVHNKHFSSIATYGKQADGTQTLLGLAILFPTRLYRQSQTSLATDSISNTSYVVLAPSEKTAIYFVAGWEKTDKRFSTEEGFMAYLKETAEKLANPVKTTFIHTK